MISAHAIIAPSANIAKDVTIGPFSVIGENVTIGSGTVIKSHVVINGETVIGKNNKFFQFASIGEDCQDTKYNGENTKLVIGDNNTFREGCTIHCGTVQGGGVTKIGNKNLFMVNTHVAHDCFVGNNTVFSNGASIAGHVTVLDHATLGGLVGVHQFCAIGEHSFAAGGAIIYKDVLPFVIVAGNPAKANGINLVGLERRGFSVETISHLKQAYKIILKNSATVKESILHLTDLIDKCSDVSLFKDFLQKSERGIVR